MHKRTFKSQGFELLWNVPETSTEYNGLAKNRQGDPCLDDALENLWYRTGANQFRDSLCEHLEKTLGVKRENNGTEDEPKWENEGKYIKRCVVAYAEKNGIDPASNDARNKFIAEFSPAAQAIVDGIKCDPAEKERTGGGSNLIAKTYLQWATTAVKKGIGTDEKGSASWLAVRLAKALNKEPVVFGDVEEDNIKTLAKEIAANEKRKRDEQSAQAKAEYGIEEVAATT